MVLSRSVKLSTAGQMGKQSGEKPTFTSMIETTRLISRPLTAHELPLYVYDLPKFEAGAGLGPSHHHHSADLLWMVSAITEPALKINQTMHLYYTIWVVINKETRQLVADWGFKGPPNEAGAIEIGYGTHLGQRGKGYMTETVGGILAWARTHPPIRQVWAETEVTNVASQRVLEYNQFQAGNGHEGLLGWYHDLGN
jgi:[ribosomal protein S5]-alanine N-acetyltransferase